MTVTPQTEVTQWAANQASPWLVHNESNRVWDAFATKTTIEDRDLTAPPVNCDDGARYLVKATATGLWAGHDGELAIAFGTDAANGWTFCTIAKTGNQIYVRDEALLIEYFSGNWNVAPDRITALDELSDVSIVGPLDGDTLVYEASSGQWMPASVHTHGSALAYVGTDLTAQNLTTPAAIAFNTEDHDTDSFHDAAANTRMTAPAAGKYEFGFNLEIANSASANHLRAWVYKGGSATWTGKVGNSTELSATSNVTISAVGLATLAAGDYLQVFLGSESDTSIDIVATVSSFWMRRV